MSDHLPECDLSRDCGLFHGQDYCHNCEQSCICAALRACEQRMYEWSKSFGVGKTFYDAGRADGLDAAEADIWKVDGWRIGGTLVIPAADAVNVVRTLKEKP